MHKAIVKWFTIVSVLTASIATASQARAATFPCTQVTKVYWGNNGQLAIDCSGEPNQFFNSNNCATVPATIDDRKAWEALATSALLAGKGLTIEYDGGTVPLLCPSNGPGTIGSISLAK
jgi:hypothetical protein